MCCVDFYKRGCVLKISIQNKSFIHFQSYIKHNDKLLTTLFESIQVMCIGKEGVLHF